MKKAPQRAKLEQEITDAHDEIASASVARREAQDREQAAFKRLNDAEWALRRLDFPEIFK